jgi:hypothetical protein
MRIPLLKFVDTLCSALLGSVHDEKANKMEPARPLKPSSGTPIAGGGEPPYDGGMEHRMTALETRFDTILPTLATKADVDILRADIDTLRISMKADSAAIRTELENTALRMEVKFHELRGDMHEMHASIKTWMLGTVISMTGIVLAAVVAISQIHRITTPVAAAQPTHNVAPASPR